MNTRQLVKLPEELPEKIGGINKSDSQDMIIYNWPNKSELEAFPAQMMNKISPKDTNIRFDVGNTLEFSHFMKKY